MPNNLYAFLISTFAGISTLIGYLFIYIKRNRTNMISSSLGFASGVMITISIIDLIPNSFILINKHYSNNLTILLIIVGFLIGIVLSNILDKVVSKYSNQTNKLYNLGLLTMLAIITHNIPEGIATYITSTNNTKLGLTLAVAIALHNIPEGISISIPLYYSSNSKLKPLILTFISGMSEPLGAIMCYIFLSKYISNTVLGVVYAFIAGIMINISINDLYKESFLTNKKLSIIYSIMGIVLMILSHIIIG